MQGSKSNPGVTPGRFPRQRKYLTLLIWVVGICLSFGVYTLAVNALAHNAAGTAYAPPRPLPALNGAVVKIDPATSTPILGESFTVTVRVQNVQNLGAFQFDVAFSSSVVTVTAVEVGPFLGSTGRTVFPISPVYGADRVTCAASSFGTGSGPNGDGVLVTLTLQARGTGDSPLDLSNVTLTDPDAGPISASAEDGLVTVSPSEVSPVVSSITPNWGCTSRVLRNVVVVGQNFQTGASVQLARSGQSPIFAEMPVVQSATRISCTLSIGKATLGKWTVRVTNPGARSGELANGFTVKVCNCLPAVLRSH